MDLHGVSHISPASLDSKDNWQLRQSNLNHAEKRVNRFNAMNYDGLVLLMVKCNDFTNLSNERYGMFLLPASPEGLGIAAFYC